MMVWKILRLIAFRPEMAPPLPVKVLINHASRWAVMGLSSTGNELIYYQAPSVGGRQASGERGEPPDTRAQDPFSPGSVSGNTLISEHPLALKKRDAVRRELESLALPVMQEAGLALWYPLHLTHEMRVRP